MTRRSLAWRLYPAFVLIVMVCILGAVLYAVTSSPGGRIGSLYARMAVAAVAALLGAGAAVALVALWVRRATREMIAGARRLAEGHFDRRIHPPAVREFGELADALNEIALAMKERIRALSARSGEQDAVLESMSEGVVAVDTGQRILSLNRAAAELVGADRTLAAGRVLSEVVRNIELADFAARTLRSPAPVEAQIILRDQGQERFIQARGTALVDAAGRRIGALLVLNDLTRLHQLQTVRRDFVANVSHELKTPITSIRGFVETLREGALEDPDKARRFLDIISRQAKRLQAIVDDLLALSRIERQARRDQVEVTETPLRTVLQAALDDCQAKSAQPHVTIDLDCLESLSARINGALIEQALVNLLDNAIKHSPPESTVHVRAELTRHDLAISVRDSGCGIAKEHLERIFERFYRVDKARSRDLGGTGLGLAIVKHIAQAHGGTVDVQSVPGQGSTFTIVLPVRE